ncbi:dihydrofolate reductase family protein [Pseudonocardia sp. NPDC049635]|uniref:dihydrofolate reductase family protein n=1 Tax=Pseudonocardia sp. NPDC049635 TaxID=3155506 RepID=UPI0033EBEE6B
MRLTSTVFVSVDGVYQGPGGPEEDLSGGFTRGGWLVPHFDDELGSVMDGIFGRADAFLLGRHTYDIFAASWGAMADPGDDPIAVGFATLPKYVVSTMSTTPSWAGTSVLPGEVGAVAELKRKPGRELQVHGSGLLVRWLLANELLDELTLVVAPVVVGAGRRLFPDPGLETALTLTGSRTTPAGVGVLTYQVGGRPEYGLIEVE